MPGVSKIVYKGKEIIFVDYRGCTDENDMINLFREATRTITGFGKDSLVLINFEGGYQTPNYMKKAEQLARKTQNYVKKRAIVGINNPARLILLNESNRLLGEKKIRPFKNMKKAKEWLVM